jgi:GMP synthase-like glutamine amidotransferase
MFLFTFVPAGLSRAPSLNTTVLHRYGAAGIILSGGPNSVIDDETPRALQAVFEISVPVLGICYGMQTMAARLGGQVENGKVREFDDALMPG